MCTSQGNAQQDSSQTLHQAGRAGPDACTPGTVPSELGGSQNGLTASTRSDFGECGLPTESNGLGGAPGASEHVNLVSPERPAMRASQNGITRNSSRALPPPPVPTIKFHQITARPVRLLRSRRKVPRQQCALSPRRSRADSAPATQARCGQVAKLFADSTEPAGLLRVLLARGIFLQRWRRRSAALSSAVGKRFARNDTIAAIGPTSARATPNPGRAQIALEFSMPLLWPVADCGGPRSRRQPPCRAARSGGPI